MLRERVAVRRGITLALFFFEEEDGGGGGFGGGEKKLFINVCAAQSPSSTSKWGTCIDACACAIERREETKTFGSKVTR